ncbi:MAG TPA: hypothetical protein VFA07_07850 [Chthonomonadaceae bacterium]|nr:hypothetical protein [Chthonomonadaceae bacterium]
MEPTHLKPSYEELREALLDFLATRLAEVRSNPDANSGFEFSQMTRALESQFAKKHLAQTPNGDPTRTLDSGGSQLSDKARMDLIEVFWDLFREGIITLGQSIEQPDFPYFHVGRRGASVLETRTAYRYLARQSGDQ